MDRWTAGRPGNGPEDFDDDDDDYDDDDDHHHVDDVVDDGDDRQAGRPHNLKIVMTMRRF